MNVCMSYKMQYKRIAVSEGIDINKSNESKEYMFVINGILKIMVLSMNHMPVMNVVIYQ